MLCYLLHELYFGDHMSQSLRAMLVKEMREERIFKTFADISLYSYLWQTFV